MKKIIHLTVFLALISALAGGALAYANYLTAPVIAQNEMAAEKETLTVLFPDVDDSAFIPVDVKGNSEIEKIFEVEGEGYIFKLKVSGYKEGTSFMVSMDKDGVITNYTVISNGDTSGIGDRVAGDSFRDSLIGKKATEELDTISGATVSSTPVVNGIHTAGQYLADNLK